MQVSDFPAIFKADFGLFRRISAVFWPVSAISAAGRYDPIWPIRLDFGRIRLVRHELKPIRHESKPIRHESSCVGANPRKKKKKKHRRGPTREQPRQTPRPASSRIGRRCGTSSAASVLSR